MPSIHRSRFATCIVFLFFAALANTASSEPLANIQTLQGSPLSTALASVFSADGRFVYTAGNDGVSVLARDLVTGETTLTQQLWNEVGDVEGIRGFPAMALSPDGRHLYVTGNSSHSIALFAREENTGRLTFVRAWFRFGGDFPLPRTLRPVAVTVSGDGNYVYVSGDSGIGLFRRDPTDGELTYLPIGGGSTDPVSPSSYCSLSKDGRFAYSAGVSGLGIYERNEATGGLSLLEWISRGSFPGDTKLGALSLSPNGEHLYALGLEEDALLVLERDTSTGLLSHVETIFDGQDGVDGLDAPTALTVSPDGSRVYAVAFNDEALTIFDRDVQSGRLNFVEAQFQANEGIDWLSDALYVEVSPDGRFIHAGAAAGGAIFEWDGNETNFVDNLVNASEDLEGLNGAWNLAMSPDGRHLYTANGSTLTAFSRDGEGTKLQFLEALHGIEELSSWGLELSPDGRHLYNFGTRGIDFADPGKSPVVFSRDPIDGSLELVEVGSDIPCDEVPCLNRILKAVFSPDGRFLYGIGQSALVVYRRDLESGRLTLVEIVRGNPNSTVEKFEIALDLALSPDGRYLYVGDNLTSGRGIYLFERNPEDGRLSFLQIASGFHGDLLTISPDGRHLYSSRGGTIRIYERDLESGALSFLDSITDEHEAGDFDSFIALEFEPRGEYLYVTNLSDHFLLVYRRDPRTGLLNLVDRNQDERDGGGTPGLLFPMDIALSPGGHALYVISLRDGTITAFTPSCELEGSLCLGTERFRVEIAWRDFDGRQGLAQTVPFGSNDSALLWFFDQDNWEMLVKVINGCNGNGNYWVFAAATTNLEYTLRVTDTLTGVSKSYFNPLGTASPAITDIRALAACPAGSAATGEGSVAGAELAHWQKATPSDLVPSTTRKAATGCTDGNTTICLGDERFQVEVDWLDFEGQPGRAQVVPFGSADSGLFWFFDEDNWEMLVKIVDGCEFNDRFWVFSAATTNIEYTLRVTDTATGEVREFDNPLGISADAVTDTDVFATCP